MNTFEFSIAWYQPPQSLFETIQHGLTLGLLLSTPLTPAFLISVRESCVQKQTGVLCFLGSLIAIFFSLFFILFGSSDTLRVWYFIEPLFSILGLFLIFRLATALDASPNRFLGFLSFEIPSNKLALADGTSADLAGQSTNPFQKVFSVLSFAFFNFKPAKTQGSVLSLTTMEKWKYIVLGASLVFTNPFLLTPISHALYSIQYEDFQSRIILGVSAFSIFALTNYLLLQFFVKILPPLFFGEVNKTTFLVDTCLACLLSITILLPLAHGSWREAFWRIPDSALTAIPFEKVFNRNKTTEGESENVKRDEPEFAHFQYAGEYQSPTFKEPMIQYNRSRPWYDLPPLTPYQFEYGVRKYRLSAARLFGQKYFSFFSSNAIEQAKFQSNISLFYFLEKMYANIPFLQGHALFENTDSFKAYSTLDEQKVSKKMGLTEFRKSTNDNETDLVFSFEGNFPSLEKQNNGVFFKEGKLISREYVNPLSKNVSENLSTVHSQTHKNIGFKATQTGEHPEKSFFLWSYDDSGPSKRFVKYLTDKQNNTLINKNSLKGYPSFSYARLLPVSNEERTKLRTDMEIYTAELM